MKRVPNALDVAKYLLVKANFDGELITHLKMQKLLYYAQAWYLVNFSSPLFSDEIKAWRYGPIIESVYHNFKKFKYAPITYGDEENIESKIPTNAKRFLFEFYKIFIRYSASDLTQMSHDDAPWRESKPSAVIPIDAIMAFYKKKYKEQREKEAQKTI